MTHTNEAARNVAIGVGGTLASVGLSQWESIAAIAAGFATALFMLVKVWQVVRKK